MLLTGLNSIHHDVVFGMAIKQRINGGHADQLIFSRMELKRRVFDFGRDAGELSLAFLICVNAHVEFVEAAESISNMHIDQRRKEGLTVRGGDV